MASTPVQWRIAIEARGDHFTGEERDGTKYGHLVRWKASQKGDHASGKYYVQQWNTVEVIRGPAGKDKTTTTKYGKSRRQGLAEKPERNRHGRALSGAIPPRSC